MAVESPKYHVDLKSDEFEIRTYEPVILAEIIIRGDFKSASNLGFRRLAAFIFGANIKNDKISMTAPVGLENRSENISMTAPVGAEQRDNQYAITFTMPAEYTIETLPKPKDREIIIRAIPKKTYGVITFSGIWSDSRYKDRLSRLKEWMVAKQLKAKGEPVFARYNPPWTPWFLRRNEILIEILKN